VVHNSGDHVNSIKARAKSALGNQQVLLLIVLTVMILGFSLKSPDFFARPVFANILSDWYPLILIAIGETFVIISGGIDLSVGATVGFSGVVSAIAMEHLTTAHYGPDVTLFIGFLVAVGIGLIVGILNTLMITKAGVVPFIATLVTLGAGEGLSVVFTGGAPIGGGPSNAINLSVANIFGLFSRPGLLIILLVIVLGLYLHKARFGRYTFAIGSNPFAARAAGINVNRHLAKVYILSAVLSSFAGYYFYLRLSVGAPTTGNGAELQAIAAVVIGGVALSGGQGNFLGTVLGASIISVVASGLLFINVPANWKQVVVAALIFVAVFLQELRTRVRK